jgi:hypothetical protein
MSHALRHGLFALLAGAICAAGIAVQAAHASDAAVAGAEATVLAQTDPTTPTPAAPPGGEPMDDPAAGPEGESAGAAPAGEAESAPEPKVVETERMVWLGLMVPVIIALVVWLFSRNRPKDVAR